MYKDVLFADLFAGGGGTTTGALSVPGIKVAWALNHSDIAIKVHARNHPETKHYQADIRTQDVSELQPVDVLWASLECTQHSRAKGGGSKKIGSYTLGWELIRYILHCDPSVIIIENVSEFRKWSYLDANGIPDQTKIGYEFRKWVNTIKDLGYNYEDKDLNSADYGAPTRRIRYFGVFLKTGYKFNWPKQTHHKTAYNGYQKWVPCRDYIELEKEGNSIFGRELNELVAKGKRKPLSANTLKRIAGGLKKYAPEIWYLMSYYGNGHNCNSINEPAPVIASRNGKDGIALVKYEKLQFIQDHVQTDNFQLPNEPLKPQLTRQTKQLITIKKQFADSYYGRDNSSQNLDEPISTICTENSKHLVTVEGKFIDTYYTSNFATASLDMPLPVIRTATGGSLISSKAQFISPTYNSNGHPEANHASIQEPLPSLTSKEKMQFISAYFNSNGHPETQNQSITEPLNSILTASNKKALITGINLGYFDFDIKMRFLDVEELGSIMGFPSGYFEGVSKKNAIKLIGNAVQTKMASALIGSYSQILTS